MNTIHLTRTFQDDERRSFHEHYTVIPLDHFKTTNEGARVNINITQHMN